MKRLGRTAALVVAIGVCAGFSAPAAADDETDLSWKIDVRPRGDVFIGREFGVNPDILNYPRTDHFDAVSQRSRLTADVSRGALRGQMVLQHSAVWGDHGGDDLNDPGALVHQAWFEAEVAKWFSFRLGRLTLAYGDQKVLGITNWNQVNRAWDGAVLMFQPIKGLQIDVLGAQYAEGTSAPANPDSYNGSLFDEDAYLGGVYATLGDGLLDPVLTELDIYALQDVRLESPSEEASLQSRRQLSTLGTRLHRKLAPIDITLEGAWQLGSSCIENEEGTCTDDKNDHNAWFADSEIGVKLAVVRLFVGFGQASGDDPETADIEGYNHLYPSAHARLGLMDLIGPRTNVREIRGGATLKLKKWSFTAVYHEFARLEPEDERVGGEVNLVTKARLLRYLQLLAVAGYFFPDDGITADESVPEGVAQWYTLQVMATF